MKILYKLDNPKHNRYYIGKDWYCVEVQIKDETSRSYILDNVRETKVNKKTLLGTPDYAGIQEQYFLTKEEAEDYIWYKNNRHSIRQNSNIVAIFKCIKIWLKD